MKWIKNALCNGCHACYNVCPKHCIEMVSDEEGFLYPKLNQIQCIDCGLCEKVCPALKNHGLVSEGCSSVYAATHKNEIIRKESSSGGIFTAIATYVIENGGVVFGAAFTENFRVEHRYTDTLEGLSEFRGSKYVQSTIGIAYKQAEKFLEEGRLVLFTGTPCQIGGLFTTLKKTYDNLITQDIICHGVPSPMVWKKYVEYRQKKANGATPQRIAFRAKNEGWKRYSVSFIFDNDTEYRQIYGKDPMMQVFLRNLCLRPSCYDCVFKTEKRQSDITLADFWGIENILPEMDDDRGTSLILIHSSKGQKLFQKIKDILIFQTVEKEKAISYNSAMILSAKRPKERNEFMKMVQTKDFSWLNKKYCKVSIFTKIKRKLGCIKNKIFRRKQS